MLAGGISIDELPEDYQDYKEQIKLLRSYGLGLREKTAYEELIEWLETHDGRMPRGSFSRDKVYIDDLTKQKRMERNLYQKWIKSAERKALDECRRNSN